jgi:hypothetical protein
MNTEREEIITIDTGVDLDREAVNIIQRNQLTMSIDLRNKLMIDLVDDLKPIILLGNNVTRTTVLGVALVAIAIILLVLLIDDTPAWAYILYGVVGAVVIAGFVLLGLTIIKNKRYKKRKEIASFLIIRIANWTRDQLIVEQSLNVRRFLIENLMNCVFDYRKFDEKSAHLNSELHEVVSEIINEPRNIDCLQLLYYLFKSVFRGTNDRFDERGFLILMKILAPILNYSANDNLNSAIQNIIRSFVKQTRVNFYMSELRLVNLDPEEKILIVKQNLKDFKAEYELFADVWQMSFAFRVNRPSAHPGLASRQTDDKSQTFSTFYKTNALQRSNEHNGQLQTNNHLISEHDLSVNQPELNLSVQPSPNIRLLNIQNDDILDNQPSITFVRRNTPEDIINQNIEFDQKLLENDFVPDQLGHPEVANADNLNSFRDSRVFQNSYLHSASHLKFNRSITNIKEIMVTDQLIESKFETDDSVKHLLEIEAEPESKYKIMIKNEKMTILRKTEEGNPVVLIKSTSIVEGPADKIFQLIYDMNYRSKWDKVFSNLKIVKILNENTDVMYTYLKAPFMIADRDFLQKRTCYKNFRNIDYVIAFRSWDDAEIPPIKNVIRANTVISGYIIRAVTPIKCSLTMISQTDIKGSIPKSIINAFAAKAPLDWIKRLEIALNLFKCE